MMVKLQTGLHFVATVVVLTQHATFTPSEALKLGIFAKFSNVSEMLRRRESTPKLLDESPASELLELDREELLSKYKAAQQKIEACKKILDTYLQHIPATITLGDSAKKASESDFKCKISQSVITEDEDARWTVDGEGPFSRDAIFKRLAGDDIIYTTPKTGEALGTRALYRSNGAIDCESTVNLNLEAANYIEKADFTQAAVFVMNEIEFVTYVSSYVDHEGKKYGYGIFRYATGAMYVGQFFQDKPHGYGVFFHANVEKYKGYYNKGKRHGYGVFTLADGTKYEGFFKNDKMHGSGVFSWVNGDKYVGDFKENKRNGNGVYTRFVTTTENEKYVGRFENGEKHGYGVYTYANGNKYEGNFKAGNKEGRGVYFFSNGDRYDGNFSNDRMHGEGTRTYASGVEQYVGTWNQGEEHNGISIWKDKEGRRTIKSTWKNGVLQTEQTGITSRYSGFSALSNELVDLMTDYCNGAIEDKIDHGIEALGFFSKDIDKYGIESLGSFHFQAKLSASDKELLTRYLLKVKKFAPHLNAEWLNTLEYDLD